jgi:hypothetical protein
MSAVEKITMSDDVTEMNKIVSESMPSEGYICVPTS